MTTSERPDSVAEGSGIVEISENNYSIRPSLDRKFRKDKAEQIMEDVIKEKLNNVDYQADNIATWTKEIADDVRNRLSELEADRYKYIVQVVIGEQRGEGVQMACRCFWDSDSDSYAQKTYISSSLFCSATVFACYYY